jgi:subtilase family serine protease
MDDGNAWASSHQTFDDLIPCGFNSYGSENLHHKGKDQANGFSLMDDWIIKGWIVHLHRHYSCDYQ